MHTEELMHCTDKGKGASLASKPSRSLLYRIR